MKKFLSAVAMSTALILVANPAQASPQNGGSNPLSGLMGWLNEATQKVEEYANSIKDKLAPLGEEFEKIADNAIGQLGLPDPMKVREEADKVVSDSPIHATGGVANEIDRQSARASASSILSEEGQELQVQAYEGTQQSIETVDQQSKTADQQVVTQNVMKQIAAQNAETSKVLGGMRSDLLKMNEQQAQGNVQLGNISNTLDGQKAAQNAERVGAGFSNLRTASFGGLF